MKVWWIYEINCGGQRVEKGIGGGGRRGGEELKDKEMGEFKEGKKKGKKYMERMKEEWTEEEMKGK